MPRPKTTTQTTAVDKPKTSRRRPQPKTGGEDQPKRRRRVREKQQKFSEMNITAIQERIAAGEETPGKVVKGPNRSAKGKEAKKADLRRLAVNAKSRAKYAEDEDHRQGLVNDRLAKYHWRVISALMSKLSLAQAKDVFIQLGMLTKAAAGKKSMKQLSAVMREAVFAQEIKAKDVKSALGVAMRDGGKGAGKTTENKGKSGKASAYQIRKAKEWMDTVGYVDLKSVARAVGLVRGRAPVEKKLASMVLAAVKAGEVTVKQLREAA